MASRSAKRAEHKPLHTTLVSRTAFRVLAGVTDAELALWEREEFIVPVNRADSVGEPLYDTLALRRARLIRTLGEELEVNLPGIEVILHLLDQIGR
jgi:DNA-binding transcriptional MerR regulator